MQEIYFTSQGTFAPISQKLFIDNETKANEPFLITLEQAALMLNFESIEAFEKELYERFILMGNKDNRNKPFRIHLDNGLFALQVSEFVYQGKFRLNYKTFMTSKGLEWISGELEVQSK